MPGSGVKGSPSPWEHPLVFSKGVEFSDGIDEKEYLENRDPCRVGEMVLLLSMLHILSGIAVVTVRLLPKGQVES